jgi:hypothetical protein
MGDIRYCISYDGDDVVTIPGVGLFQRGTSAWVSEQVARNVLGRGERWSCVGEDGAPLGGAPAPAPAPPPKAEKQEKAEKAEKPEKAEKAAEAKPADPPTKAAEAPKAEAAPEAKKGD